MPTLNVTTRDGTRLAVEARAGLSIMENIRNAGITEMVALCGGTLSCATCHVYVDEILRARLPAPSEDETAMLEVCDHRLPNSRLSCQLLFGDDFDKLAITIAP
jgi:ferredoxin, 2Fe-2S